MAFKISMNINDEKELSINNVVLIFCLMAHKIGIDD